jgi:transcription initiation factor TFIID subunit 12
MDHEQVLSKYKLRELLCQLDAPESLEEDVETVLLNLADDFIYNVLKSSCQLAKHRGSDTLSNKDIKLHLERMYNIKVPGFGTVEEKLLKRNQPTAEYLAKASAVKKAIASEAAEKEKEK